jgi:hypothetical protein
MYAGTAGTFWASDDDPANFVHLVSKVDKTNKGVQNDVFFDENKLFSCFFIRSRYPETSSILGLERD